MKPVSCLIIILALGLVCNAFAEEWYEGAESSSYDYIGSTGKMMASESDTAKYTPEYAATELRKTMIETDKSTNFDRVSRGPDGLWVDSCAGPVFIPNHPEPGVITGIPVCFAEDTLITTDKGIKRIDAIKDGDMILGKDGFKKVVKVVESPGKPNLSLNGIEMADVHPIIMENGDAKKAKEIMSGDILFNGVEVKTLEKISSEKKLYNLDVEGDTYYVGDILVSSGTHPAE